MTKKQLEEKIKGLEKTIRDYQREVTEINKNLEDTRNNKNVVSEVEFDRLLKDLENERALKEHYRQIAERNQSNKFRTENEKLKEVLANKSVQIEELKKYNAKVGRKKVISEKKRQEIRKLYATGNYSMQKLADKYNVSKNAICKIIKEKNSI